MSKYTTEVRFVCEVSAGLTESVGYNSIDAVLDKAIPVVFDFDFPMFDENYRNILERKILKHYYTREIGEETVGLWKLRLNTKLNEIMPYYNQLYKSELLEFNPLYDFEVRTTHLKDNKSNISKAGSRQESYSRNENTGSTVNTETQSTENNLNWDLYSDTPQGILKNIDDMTYLTNARKNTDDANSNVVGETSEVGNLNRSDSTNENTTNKTDLKSLEDYSELVVGKKSGNGYSFYLNEFRKTFLNIDMMIIEELESLFMQLW